MVFTIDNIAHIAKHSVIADEVKEVIEGKPIFIGAKLNRIMAIGPTNFGRALVIVLDKIDNEKYYVVTARDANKKERLKYEDQKRRWH